jgi:hypothetical protein
LRKDILEFGYLRQVGQVHDPLTLPLQQQAV